MNAHQNVLCLRILLAEIVGVVGGDKGDACFLMDADQRGIHLLLGRNAVVLELQVVAVLSKQLPHLQCHRLSLLILPRQQQLGQFSAQAGGAGDQAASVLPQ